MCSSLQVEEWLNSVELSKSGLGDANQIIQELTEGRVGGCEPNYPGVNRVLACEVVCKSKIGSRVGGCRPNYPVTVMTFK